MLLCYTKQVMTKPVNPEKQQKFGKKLKKAREEMGLSQEDVAKAAGIASGYYARVERGKHNPSSSVLGRICKVLKIEPSEISALLTGL